MSALNIWVMSFAAISLVWFSVWWVQLVETKHLRDLCRRCAEHLGNECHTGIKDIETHRALTAECERAGWDEGGKER